MTDIKTLIEKYPRTVKACGIDDGTSHLRFACAVKDYANLNSIGDFAFDSVESLMHAIESHLAAKEPQPLTEAEVAKMRWSWVNDLQDNVFGKLIRGGVFFTASIRQRDDAIAAHNADIDRLWAEVNRLRAKCGEVQQ